MQQPPGHARTEGNTARPDLEVAASIPPGETRLLEIWPQRPLRPDRLRVLRGSTSLTITSLLVVRDDEQLAVDGVPPFVIGPRLLSLAPGDRIAFKVRNDGTAAHDVALRIDGTELR